jgi:hypothetical protein
MAARPESKEATKQIVCEPAIIKAPQMSTWNDKRLDRLEHRMDEGFKEVKGEIKEARQEMRAGFAGVDKDMKEGFARIDRLTNTLLGGTFGVIAAIVVAGIFG